MCRSDPLPFQYLGAHPELCQNATFVDVDYPQLMQKKLQVIQQTPQLTQLLRDLHVQNAPNVHLATAKGYRAYGCDLRELDKLDAALREDFDMDLCTVTILFVAEVSVAYMDLDPANALMKWAGSLNDGKQVPAILSVCVSILLVISSILSSRTTSSRRERSSFCTDNAATF